MSCFIWLASYPKSGNTWVRAFLTSLRQDGRPVNINQLDFAQQPSARAIMDEMLGISTSELSNEEILQARPAALAAYAATQKGTQICKIHEAWLKNNAGQPYFPSELTAASVYIVRDPRDVAISFAHHLGCSIDHIIGRMANPDDALSRSNGWITLNTIQPLLTWSQHVESWLDLATPSPLLVRYEDMLANPLEQGSRIARHVGMEKPQAICEQAVRSSGFKELYKQEHSEGFSEARSPDRPFFRSGRAGGWKEKLSSAQISRIEQAHGAVMTRLGYL